MRRSTGNFYTEVQPFGQTDCYFFYIVEEIEFTNLKKKYSMKIISKPAIDFPDFYKPYLDCVPEDGQLIQHLKNILEETEELILSLSDGQLLYRYAEGKWTIKDILLHLCDCERVIIYRAMRIARADKTDLPGFDENHFVAIANATNRNTKDMLEELRAYRGASVLFINSLDEESLNRTGTANSYTLSARLLVNHLYGHHRRHLNIISERYLK